MSLSSSTESSSTDLSWSCTAETASFIANQIGRRSQAGSGALQHRRLTVLGLSPDGHHGSSRYQRSPRQRGLDEIRLCAQLLREGAQLVVLDRPRNRLLIETLLPLAADRDGRILGDIHLEANLSSAFWAADAVLLLPGWRPERPLAWGALASRLQPGAEVFDLRPGGACDRAAACGLRLWHLGSFAAVL